jgi:hypothetical protein
MDSPTTALPLSTVAITDDTVIAPDRLEEAVIQAHTLARGGDHIRADKLYLAAANGGSPTAMAFVGSRLLGRGEPAQRTEAIRWLEKAIEQGERTVAPLTLGIELLRGKNVPQDRDRGVALLGMSARAGSGLALRLLVRVLATGRFGVRRNNRDAALWLAMRAPDKVKWGIYATHYLGLAPLRDRIARPLILKLSQEARRQRRMSPQQRALEAQRKRATLLKRQKEREVSSS